MNRRQFISRTGQVAILLQVLPALKAQAQEAQYLDQDQLVIESAISRFFPASDHWHYLYIPLEQLKNPPADGVSLTTSRAYLHTHTVNLTQEQLASVQSGETVTVADTVTDHQYTIALPKNSTATPQ